ncbi:MAG: hypothetical protein IH595_03630 [Bacteroidales bacterium]|nr:hypothetical protein [Bacteroidales bacterium]
MTSPSYVDALKSLTRNEAYVLYWKCYGSNYVQIAQKLDFGEDWVTLQMSRVYKKLGFNKEIHSSERKRILKTTYCPLFNDLIEGQYSNIDKWIPIPTPVEVGVGVNKEEPKEEPTPDPEMLALVLYDAKQTEEDESKKPKPDPPVIHVPARLPAPRPTLAERFRRIFIFAIIVLTVICAVGYFAFRFGQQSLSLVPQPSSPTPIELPTLTDTPPPSFTPTLLLTETPQLTNTPIPTDTIEPTFTATSLPAEIPLFFDDFTDGKSDMWQTIFGESIIVDNALNFVDDTLMLVEGKDWTNYEVSFDVSNMGCTKNASSSGMYLGLHFQDPNNMVMLRLLHFRDCASTWTIIRDGTTNVIPNATYNLPSEANRGTIHIVVSVVGNKYDFPFGKPVIIEDYPQGGVSISSYKGVIIDNFKITLLNK